MECVSVTKMFFKMCIQPLTPNYAIKFFFGRSFLENWVIILVIVPILVLETLNFIKMASKQKLSPAAKKRKAARDLAFAKTPARRAKKAHAQRERRKAKRRGVNVKGKDWDHKDGRWEKVSRNRANDGEGTKKEGNKRYKVPKRKTKSKK